MSMPELAAYCGNVDLGADLQKFIAILVFYWGRLICYPPKRELVKCDTDKPEIEYSEMRGKHARIDR